MDIESNESYNIEEEPIQDHLEIVCSELNEEQQADSKTDGSEKHCAVWTTNATSILLKLYENKLQMLETPKKKRRIWVAIAESLQESDIEMTPDQVRWKINALTKKYKQCVDRGQQGKFKYFNTIHNIYLQYPQYHVDCDSFILTDVLHSKREYNLRIGTDTYTNQESKAVIEMRKNRLANRIECDISQGKIQLERQWLEYLRRQEEQKQWRDDIFERNLKLKEEELGLRKKELEIKEVIENKKIELMEKEYDNILQVEREKCDLLKGLFRK